MFSGVSDFAFVSGMLAFLAYLGLGAHFVLGLSRHEVKFRPVSVLYLAALCSTALWALCAGWGELPRVPLSLQAFWAPLFDSLRYAMLFGFLLTLLQPNLAVPGRSEFRVFAGAALLCVVAALVFIVGMAARWQGFEPSGRAAALLALSEAVLGLMLVEQLVRNLPPDSRWNAKPVCLGLGLVFCFDLFLYSQAALFRNFDIDGLSVRALVHALAVPLLWLASRRKADWMGRLHVSRAAVFQSAALLLVGGYLLSVAGLGYYVRYTGGEWGRALQWVLTALGLLALTALLLSESVRARVRVYISKNFFNYRYDYRQEWLRFTAVLSSGGEAQMGVTVVRALANLLEAGSGLLLLNRDGNLVRAAQWNLDLGGMQERADSEFSRFLRMKGWVVDLDEVRAGRASAMPVSVPQWLLGEPRFWLVVPLLAGSELIGMVVLGRARAAVDINWEVRDLLKTGASQASSYLAQMQAAEALLEARKFEAFNRMSAFVVHDLKNIVTQLSLMMRNAQRLRDNPEFQQDMLDTVENSLDKMRQLMLQLREGEKPHGVSSGVDLEAIAQRLAQAAHVKGRELGLRIGGAIRTRGHEERVERVIGHVVQNAFDATPQDRSVTLSLDHAGSQARVQVVDQGCGMSEDFIQNHLFKPFQTTKTNGMGIGAFESYQYLQELGGRITVESKLNEGTTVTILLPLFHAESKSAVSMAVGK
ncbi:MAG: PEP-CTERM system histidine kinase PrsK [Paucibacter sp.]|nr:PEP-CTERM system histidine kinase PrsK [Roseateles sp.]